jgi:hypothetical protein
VHFRGSEGLKLDQTGLLGLFWAVLSEFSQFTRFGGFWLIFLLNKRFSPKFRGVSLFWPKGYGEYHFFGRKGVGGTSILAYDPLCSGPFAPILSLTWPPFKRQAAQNFAALARCRVVTNTFGDKIGLWRFGKVKTFVCRQTRK